MLKQPGAFDLTAIKHLKGLHCLRSQRKCFEGGAGPAFVEPYVSCGCRVFQQVVIGPKLVGYDSSNQMVTSYMKKNVSPVTFVRSGAELDM